MPTRSGKQTEEEENDDMTCEEENDHGFDDESIEVEVEPPRAQEGLEANLLHRASPPPRTFDFQMLA